MKVFKPIFLILTFMFSQSNLQANEVGTMNLHTNGVDDVGMKSKKDHENQQINSYTWSFARQDDRDKALQYLEKVKNENKYPLFHRFIRNTQTNMLCNKQIFRIVFLFDMPQNLATIIKTIENIQEDIKNLY